MNSDLNQAFGEVGPGSAPGPVVPEAALVVGVDAGGTRTRAVLAAADDGRLLGEGAGGPGNALTVPPARLTAHLVEAVARAVPEAARGRVVAVAGGFAGATGADEADPGRVTALTALTAALREVGIGAGALTVSSDIEAAFASAPGAPADGLALVAGTGAVAMRITDRHATTTVDGDGWLLGDEGSGFWIGREAVRAALRMADGRGGATALALSVGRALGVPGEVLPGEGGGEVILGAGSVRGGAADAGGGSGPAWPPAHREAFRMRLLPAVMAEPPIRLARLAPLVVEAARGEDAVAEAILAEAVEQLVLTVGALDPEPGERVVATGGLLGPGGPLTVPLTARLQALGLTLDWVPDGCRGAVALARLLI
ncbi:N-acetylglucosamine kinase [Streptomyces sp. NPDC002144]|uniref:N-acetylglucosamine kinase n=1 Tax=Streptomyces sp. NPDC006668 TaxID=3156903 RepID=UPI0033FAA8BD